MTEPTDPRFACDAMLGSLARWLRAAGYDSSWRADIDDWDLVREARAQGRVLLSCDTGIFRIGIVRDGDVPALQVPNGLGTQEQLAFVLDRLQLPAREPRCMACGGELTEVPRAAVEGKVPPRSFARASRFWQCGRCGRPFWQGTHWQHITERLQQARGNGDPVLPPGEKTG